MMIDIGLSLAATQSDKMIIRREQETYRNSYNEHSRSINQCLLQNTVVMGNIEWDKNETKSEAFEFYLWKYYSFNWK